MLCMLAEFVCLITLLLLMVMLCTARLLHVIQENSYVESDLHVSVLNFMALLFTEEVKFKVKLQGRHDLDFPYISDCLDDTGMSTVNYLPQCNIGTGFCVCVFAVYQINQSINQSVLKFLTGHTNNFLTILIGHYSGIVVQYKQ